MNKKNICLILAALILLSGCSAASGGRAPAQTAWLVPDATDAAAAETAPAAERETPAETPAPSPEPSSEPSPEPEPGKAGYEYDPHLYVPIILSDVPQDYWDSFHRLCDALRAGETTFECSSAEAYRWATDPATLTQLFPAAVMKIKAEGNDGTEPFANGVGRIYYQIPPDEFVKREAEFEKKVETELNGCLDPDDDDFEKALKLYDYISVRYDYQDEFQEQRSDGSVYTVIMDRTGQCVDLGALYSFLLLQAGVQALEVDGHGPTMNHAWTYLLIDGKGYYSDPTWGLRSTVGGNQLCLTYFLEDAERRGSDGFDMDDLQLPLLPKYWVRLSETRIHAENDELCFPIGSFLESLDEDGKTVRYSDDYGNGEINYGRK